jgi:hypothetical protein
MLLGVKAQFPSRVSVLLPEDYLCEPLCSFQRGELWLYQDPGHLTVAGSEHIARAARDKFKVFLTGSER